MVKIRPGVEWSDGHPWSAHDVAFTINMLVEHAPQLVYSTDMATWVEEAVALDSLTARVALKAPNPRFLFSYFVHSGDQGVPIVPKHIWEGKDPLTFANFDLQKGWPVLTGPYRIVRSEPAQRIWDLREGWWAEKLGFQKLPRVERLIYLTYMEEHKRVQNLIANNIDTCLELRPANMVSLLERNRNITTWTGREPPYSYITWWPISLGFNGLEAPWSDPEMRRAVNYAINREQLVAIGWQNSGAWTLLPLPDLPQMQRYFTLAEGLVAEHQVGVFDLAKSAEILAGKGYVRNGAFWEKDGQRLSMVIDIFSHFQDLTPVLIAQLKKAGIDASFRMTSDFSTRLRQGTARAYLIGNFSSMRDPYFVLRQYHSRFVQPTGDPGRHALALAKPGLRRADRPDGPDPNRRPGDGRTLPQGHGPLAGRVAFHPHRPMAAPHPAQRDLLDQLAQRGKPLYQQRLLEPHLALGAAELAAAGVRHCIRTEYQQTSVAKTRSQYLAFPAEPLFLIAEQVGIGNAVLT